MVNFRMVDANNRDQLERELYYFPKENNVLLHNVKTILRVDGYGFELDQYKSFLCSADGEHILLLKGTDEDQVAKAVAYYNVEANEVTLYQDDSSDVRPLPKLEDIYFASSYDDIDDDEYAYIPVDASLSLHCDTSSGEDQLLHKEYIDAALQDGKTVFVSNRLDSDILLHEMRNISLDTKGRVLKLTK
ncbi:MAG: hypothetical protein IJ193_07355 [Bacilli bacterium]|nr:hypothetical protein [Bacilli bacterium]